MSLFSADDYNQEPDESSPSIAFPELHQKIKDIIKELGGLVAPKLNWSAPKDATWISMKKNSMECATPDDIYLLLKSSDFITHDLEHAFSDTVEDEIFRKEDIDYVLVLRKWFHVNPSSEFRCFVRERNIVGICQRDPNHFDFLFNLQDVIRDVILRFFEEVLKSTFPDPDFVFDVYIVETTRRVMLMDINPWAPRTDPLLFSWYELSSQPFTNSYLELNDSDKNCLLPPDPSNEARRHDTNNSPLQPQIRLVKKSDPRAFNFASAQYSAHKLPREVVHAGLVGGSGLTDFATQWKKILNGNTEIQGSSSSDEDHD